MNSWTGEATAVTDDNDTPLWLHRDDQPEAVILRAAGELDAHTADQLDEHLREAENALTPPAPLLLDLADVTYLSSAGIATLVIHTKRCTEQNSRLSVIADHPAVLRPITLTGADTLIDVVPTLEDALKAE